MKIKTEYIYILLLIILCSFSKSVSAQFTVYQSNNYSQLVDSLVSSGVSVSNVSYSGNALSCGYFSNGDITNLGIADGIVLSTGYVADIDHGAAYDGQSNTGSPGNSMLATLSGADIFDAALLEFDVVPAYDTLSFNYIFASEDYPEWVGGNPLYQDYLGAFITGVKPQGGNYDKQNFLVVPGTNLPVIVNNINAGDHSQYYVNNPSGPVMFDGFTTLLQVKIPVIPAASYHLSIVIGDGGDQISDAGVFLKNKSLMSYGNSTGISAVSGRQVFDLYPNPTKNMIHVNCKDGYKIYSAAGHLFTESMKGAEYIDVSMLPNGIYLFETNNQFFRFIKTN